MSVPRNISVGAIITVCSPLVVVKLVLLKVNPPIVPLVAFSSPVLVTLNGASSGELFPKYIDLNFSLVELD
jgi:hypothetical protein